MVYVANFGDNTTSVIDGKTNSVVNTIYVDHAPTNDVAVNPISKIVYVTNLVDGTVSIIKG
jgi:YVTN family beta-propeller protein